MKPGSEYLIFLKQKSLESVARRGKRPEQSPMISKLVVPAPKLEEIKISNSSK